MNIKIVTAAIIQKDSSVLLCRRGLNQSLSGYWEFPGGKLEPEETLSNCLKRELFEELNVEAFVSDDIFCEVDHQCENGSIRLIAMKVELLSKLTVSNVHDEIEWVEIGSLLTYNLAPADIPIAKKLMDSK
jgi:8-oxo-dGTP diphosphatase